MALTSELYVLADGSHSGSATSTCLSPSLISFPGTVTAALSRPASDGLRAQSQLQQDLRDVGKQLGINHLLFVRNLCRLSELLRVRRGGRYSSLVEAPACRRRANLRKADKPSKWIASGSPHHFILFHFTLDGRSSLGYIVAPSYRHVLIPYKLHRKTSSPRRVRPLSAEMNWPWRCTEPSSFQEK
jgi:hypothetical protein